jgi:putative hydrolase of the HAD superfamily
MAISTLFLDIGGVLLTNGWDRTARKRAAEAFGLDLEEMNERHHLTFDTYEEGKLSLDEYLTRVIFYEKRSFTAERFKEFMFRQSQPLPEMIALIRRVKGENRLKVVAVSNEGRELAIHRTKTFRLEEFIDFFVVSSFIHIRKPDHEIYRLALDTAQVPPTEVLYIDDRSMFVEVARSLGIQGIQHSSVEHTQAVLRSFGIVVKV